MKHMGAMLFWPLMLFAGGIGISLYSPSLQVLGASLVVVGGVAFTLITGQMIISFQQFVLHKKHLEEETKRELAQQEMILRYQHGDPEHPAAPHDAATV